MVEELNKQKYETKHEGEKKLRSELMCDHQWQRRRGMKRKSVMRRRVEKEKKFLSWEWREKNVNDYKVLIINKQS